MSDNLQHVGVKGMRWGHRKAKIEGLKNVAGKVTDSKVFKAMVYDKDKALLSKKGRESFMNEFNSSASKGKSFVSKLSDTSLFKQTVFNKDTSLLTSAGRNAAKAKVKGLVEKFERHQVRAQDRDIATFKSVVDGYNNAAKTKTLSARDQKLKKEFEDQIKFMEDELNSLWTPEQLKKFREN